MSTDLSHLSVAELERVITQAKNLVETKQVDAIKEGYAQIEKIARDLNLSLDELIAAGREKGGRTKSGSRKPVEARYRNPQNASDTWTGRGKAPRWLAAKLAKGAKKEEFLI
ncbi:MAG: H-NS histone family protein [Candidatus Saccharibacteria bacterium]|nr:H-NS histone family protein [Moraxellaceae bacterium]